MIEIDGSLGEGGGQILRTSLSLAAVLGKEVRVFNIRAGRSEPGLRAQHLTALQAVATICNASSKGLEIGSSEFIFRPGRIESGSFRFEVGTAGSITLVLQTIMPLLPYLPKKLSMEVHGGTDVKWSPPIDYLRLIILPILSKMGIEVSLELVLRGHYPKGGGVVRVSSNPSGSLKPIIGQTMGVINRIFGVSHATNLPRHVAERQALAAIETVQEAGLPSAKVDIDHSQSNPLLGPGSGIVISAFAQTGSIIGSDSLGERGLIAEDIGKAAGRILIEEINSGCHLDKHMGDIIVPYIALADGTSDLSVSQITQHTVTNVRVTESITGVRFDPLPDLGKRGRLRVKGVGWAQKHVGASPRESRLICGP